MNTALILNCICGNCGEKFHTKQSHLSIGEGKFCSKKCNNEFKRFQQNIYIEHENYVEVYIKNDNISFYIDKEDLLLVNKYCWRTHRNGYIYTKQKKDGVQITIYLHRLLMQPKFFEEVDHINNIKSDNKKNNLRICNRLNNSRNRLNNTNHFKGVSQSNKLFMARVNLHGRGKNIGYFQNPEEAASAYDYAAKILYGDFCNLNNSGFVLNEEQKNKIKEKIEIFTKTDYPS